MRGKVTHRHGTEPRTGHGTFTASVINEYCPDAEIWSYRCDYPSDIISALNDVTAQVAVTGKRIMYHVGVYVGRGRVIEAKGRDDGVVLRGIDASGAGYWNKFGRLNALQK